MKSSIGAALLVGAMTVSVGTAPLLPDFTIDLDPVSSRIKKPRLLVADKLTGNYSKVLTFTLQDGTFAVEGYWDVGQIVHGDGNIPYTAQVSRLGVDYGMYALFSYEGTFVLTPSPPGSALLTAVAGSLAFYLDRGVNTGKTLPDLAPNPIALSKFSDDALLGTATLVSGEGHLRDGASLANGDFGVVFDSFVLTPLGERYFVDPAPFDQSWVLKGHVNSLEGSAIQYINGSADATIAP